MTATSIAQLLGRAYLNAHLELHTIDTERRRDDMVADDWVPLAVPAQATGPVSSLCVKFWARRAGAEAR